MSRFETKNLKSTLGTLKTEVLKLGNNERKSWKELSIGFHLVLITECLHRGVISYTVSIDDADDESMTKNSQHMYETILNVAGKSLINENSKIPKALLLAMCVISGMTCEKCAHLCEFEEIINSKPLIDKTTYDKCYHRCKDVNDDRLLSILTYMNQMNERKELQDFFFNLARSYYVHGALHYSDGPQMWKRALDVIALQQMKQNNVNQHELYHTSNASLPLYQLANIVSKKGNEKRASELYLHLAESFMCDMNKPTKSKSKCKTNLLQIFFIDLPKPTFTNTTKNIDLIQETEYALKKVNPNLLGTNFSNFYFYFIWYKMKFINESYAIQTRANEQYQRRSLLNEDTLRIEMEKARCDILISKHFNGHHDDVNEAAIKLLHSLTNTTFSTLIDEYAYSLSLAFDYLHKHISRIMDIIQLSKKNNLKHNALSIWKTLDTFIMPILQWEGFHTLNVDQISLHLQQNYMKLGMICHFSILTMAWMNHKHDKNDILNAIEFLQKYKTWHDSLNDTSTSQLGTKPKTNSILESAISAGTCHQYLHYNGIDTNTDSLFVMKIISESKTNSIDSSQFGTSYLQFLLTWSGLYQRPWSYCTITQARQIIANARSNFQQSCLQWGRPISNLERIMLMLGEAHAESDLPGGISTHAKHHYHNALELFDDTIDPQITSLLKAFIFCGLAKVELWNQQNDMDSNINQAEIYSQKSLDILTSIPKDVSHTIDFWSNSIPKAITYQICAARKLISDCLIRSDRSEEAFDFLELAVKESPNDYDANISLGAYRLHKHFYMHDHSSKDEKKTQIQLMKTAKLDSNRSDAFALLGIWYEVKHDIKRSIGCFTKAIIIDPSHPVAGRGLLRLFPNEKIKKLCHDATSIHSPNNGWAWKALGKLSSMIDDDDNSAIICYQKALRCKDIQNRDYEPLGLFFDAPSIENKHDTISNQEYSHVWSLLAACYRRLGKYSASVRAYNFAHQATNEVSPSTTCALAQVELELGLYDDAIEKFEKVLKSEASHFIAIYGKASGMFHIARRDCDEGKHGMAFFHLQIAIETLSVVLPDNFDQWNILEIGSSSTLKLLGDIYSFGAKLPPDVFIQNSSSSTDISMNPKMNFVSQGARAYSTLLSNLQDNANANPSEEEIMLQAAVACDLGTNYYIQAMLHASYLGEGSGGTLKCTMMDIAKNQTVKECLQKSIKSFLLASDSNDLIAPAWCGLGCAYSATDPLLAQHCFCRSLEIDKSSPECWANLGLLYIEYSQFSASIEALDALTQITDSPFMWIGRGMLLEKEIATPGHPGENPNTLLGEAADAYRAALQVARHPSALLGLALTSRRLQSTDAHNLYLQALKRMTKAESKAALYTYNQLTGSQNIGSCLLESIMDAEETKDRYDFDDPRSIMCGREKIQYVKNKLQQWKDNEKTNTEEKKPEDLDIKPQFSNEPSMKELLTLSEDALESTAQLQTKEKQIQLSCNTKSSHDLKRLLHENPDNGEIWMHLAKKLVKETAAIRGLSKKSKKSRSLFSAAKVAAKKAVTILNDNLVNVTMLSANRSDEGYTTSQKPAFPAQSDPSLLSESFAFLHWIEKINDANGNDQNMGSLPIALQKALIIDPDNKLAREALERYTNQIV